MEVRGAKVLITHTQVQDIMGSTIVALDVATFLKEHGADVEIYAGAAGSPAVDLFTRRGLAVKCDMDQWYDLADYDLIWVQSQVIPLSIITQLARVSPGDKVPAFVFNHMSALDIAPDEQPYLYMLEEKLTAKSLYVSQEACDKLAPFYNALPENRSIFSNPAPRGYAELPDRRQSGDKPRNVLVVSNHVPGELWEAMDLLRQRDVTVTVFGAQGRYSYITPEVLNEYDVVITIGKTVQYCLTAGIPVYVYDHFGGFGYLDDGNFEAAATNNFSGRGGVRLSATEIAAAVVNGYAQGGRYAAANRERFIKEYCIDNVLPDLLKDVGPRVLEPFSQPYELAMKSAQRYAQRYYATWALMSNVLPERDNLRREIDALRHDNDDLAGRLRECESTNEHLCGRVREIEESEAFKAGRLLMVGPHAIKKLGIWASAKLGSLGGRRNGR